MRIENSIQLPPANEASRYRFSKRSALGFCYIVSMKSSVLPLAVFMLFSILLQGQSFPSPTPALKRMEGVNEHWALKEDSWFNHLHFQNIGPTVFSGRVVDVDVNPSNPIEMYVAYASGVSGIPTITAQRLHLFLIRRLRLR
jgi:hypothetical protein